MIRWELKIKIAEVFGNQIKAARAMKIGESRLSYLVRGYVDPRPEEKKIFRSQLGVNLDEQPPPEVGKKSPWAVTTGARCGDDNASI